MTDRNGGIFLSLFVCSERQNAPWKSVSLLSSGAEITTALHWQLGHLKNLNTHLLYPSSFSTLPFPWKMLILFWQECVTLTTVVLIIYLLQWKRFPRYVSDIETDPLEGLVCQCGSPLITSSSFQSSECVPFHKASGVCDTIFITQWVCPVLSRCLLGATFPPRRNWRWAPGLHYSIDSSCT